MKTKICLLYLLGLMFAGMAYAKNPNIVFILADDLGYSSLNSYGAEKSLLRTPHIDRIAREGMRFTNASTPASICTPTRYGFLTGRYPQRHGIYDMIRNEAPDYGHKYTLDDYAVTWERIGGMDLKEVMLPQMLRQAGYYCGIFGKWDLGMHRRFLPLQRGWHEFYGLCHLL